MSDYDDDLVGRLMMKTVASCDCMTKTPEIMAHKPTCLYRLLCEAAERIAPEKFITFLP